MEVIRIMEVVNNHLDKLKNKCKCYYKIRYGIEYFCLYTTILLILFLLVIPVLNISFHIMGGVIILGYMVALYYKSDILKLSLISLGVACLVSYISYSLLYALPLDASLWEVVIICIIIFIEYIFCSNTCKISEPSKELFKEREKDLKHLTELMNQTDVNILGVESPWGTGKTLLVNHFIYNQQARYSFIRIDTIPLNLDDVIEYLILQISSELKKQFVFNKKNRSFTYYINNFQYGVLITNLLGCETTYTSEIEEFKRSVKKLRKPLILIFEDLDRIDDKDVLRKIFYISERLVADLDGKLKVIYQYSTGELIKKGFDSSYLEKYIPTMIKLTHIPFKTIFDCVTQNGQFYREVNEERSFIINGLANEVKRNLEIWRFITEIDIDKYFIEKYNIRNIEGFIRELNSKILLLNNAIEKHGVFKHILIKWCYIKYFLPEFYSSISTMIPLTHNFMFKYKNYNMDINELTQLYYEALGDKKEDINNIIDLFNPSINPLNFERLMAFSILGLTSFKNLKTPIYALKSASAFETEIYNRTGSELSTDEGFQLETLEHYFYYCISVGHELRTSDVVFVERFIDWVLNNNIHIQAYKSFKIETFKDDSFETKYLNGIDEWVINFSTFYRAAIDWDSKKIKKYFGSLIRLFFEDYKEYESNEFFQEYIFRNLNVFLEAVITYELKEAFFIMVEELNKLEVMYGIPNDRFFIKFQRTFIKALLRFKYINNTAQLENLDYLFMDYKTFAEEERKIYESILANNDEILKILELNNSNKHFEVYIDQLQGLNIFIQKLVELNEKEVREDVKTLVNKVGKSICIIKDEALDDDNFYKLVDKNMMGSIELIEAIKLRQNKKS